ncbi:MAG: PorV/PorQ family protein [Odoribacteraceae bacterium]|jgi:hypothetical protein|nr:PorV/PorQ family protein [Odoribacteraceae bacterium]
MMKRAFILVVVVVIVLLPASLRGQTAPALFLTLPADARSSGMGGGGAAIPGGAFSIFHAPSALSLPGERVAAGISRAPSLRALLPGGYLDAAAVALRVNDRAGVAAGFRRRSHPRVESLDNNGQPVGTIHPVEWATEIAYAYRLPAGLGFSVTGRYTHLNVTGEAVGALALDAGMYYRELFLSLPGATWAIAFHAENLASKITRDAYLPARATLGGAIALPVSDGELAGSLDLVYTFIPARSAHMETAVGAEYNLRYWSLRAGYRDGGGHKGIDDHASVGCTARLLPVAVHFAYWITSPSSALKNTWQLSLDFSW